MAVTLCIEFCTVEVGRTVCGKPLDNVEVPLIRGLINGFVETAAGAFGGQPLDDLKMPVLRRLCHSNLASYCAFSCTIGGEPLHDLEMTVVYSFTQCFIEIRRAVGDEPLDDREMAVECRVT